MSGRLPSFSDPETSVGIVLHLSPSLVNDMKHTVTLTVEQRRNGHRPTSDIYELLYREDHILKGGEGVFYELRRFGRPCDDPLAKRLLKHIKPKEKSS